MFICGIAGICEFCPTRQRLTTDRAFQARTYLSDDLPLHKQSHRCVQAICISLHVKLEVVLRLFPLLNASATPMARSKAGHGYLLESLLERIVYVVLRCERPRTVSEGIVNTVCIRGGFEVCLWCFCCGCESVLARRLYSQMIVNCDITRCALD